MTPAELAFAGFVGFGLSFGIQYKLIPLVVSMFGIAPADPKSRAARALVSLGGCSYCCGFWGGLAAWVLIPILPPAVSFAISAAGVGYVVNRLTE